MSGGNDTPSSEQSSRRWQSSADRIVLKEFRKACTGSSKVCLFPKIPLLCKSLFAFAGPMRV